MVKRSIHAHVQNTKKSGTRPVPVAYPLISSRSVNRASLIRDLIWDCNLHVFAALCYCTCCCTVWCTTISPTHGGAARRKEKKNRQRKSSSSALRRAEEG